MGRQRKGIPERFRVAVVGEGQTERLYFMDIKDYDRPEDLDIFPDYPKKGIGGHTGVLKRAIELAEDYSKVYALIDMDVVLQDNDRREYQRLKVEAEKIDIVVLEMSPCFEIWLLLYFRTTGKAFNQCDDVIRELRKYIPEYEKKERFLVNAGLYGNYKDTIRGTAIPNAKQLEIRRDERDERYPRAQIFKFFEWYFGRG